MMRNALVCVKFEISYRNVKRYHKNEVGVKAIFFSYMYVRRYMWCCGVVGGT